MKVDMTGTLGEDVKKYLNKVARVILENSGRRIKQNKEIIWY